MSIMVLRKCFLTALAALSLGGIGSAVAQTDESVWPTGDNGPKTWPPELKKPWWQAEKKYPEGGDPPPLNLISRLTCPEGYVRINPKSANSAP